MSVSLIAGDFVAGEIIKTIFKPVFHENVFPINDSECAEIGCVLFFYFTTM
jgi:hypothetical protein